MAEGETPLNQAIQAAGGYAEVARKLGVTRSLVWQWAKYGQRVSAERVIPLEQITGVPRSQIRPDLYPAEAEVGA